MTEHEYVPLDVWWCDTCEEPVYAYPQHRATGHPVRQLFDRRPVHVHTFRCECGEVSE